MFLLLAVSYRFHTARKLLLICLIDLLCLVVLVLLSLFLVLIVLQIHSLLSPQNVLYLKKMSISKHFDDIGSFLKVLLENLTKTVKNWV